MKSVLLAVLAVIGVSWMPGSARASVYGDDLTRCINNHSHADDTLLLMQWLFAAMAAHPDIKTMANVSDAQRTDLNKKAGALFNRLLFHDCRSQTVAALKYDGVAAIKSAFEVMGRYAMITLMGDPTVNASLSSLDSSIDEKELKEVLVEAGVVPSAP